MSLSKNMQQKISKKAHGRSKLETEQAEYVAYWMTHFIEVGYIRSLADEKDAYLKFAQEFIDKFGFGKVVKKIATVTLYDFLKKYHVQPYTKAKKTFKYASPGQQSQGHIEAQDPTDSSMGHHNSSPSEAQYQGDQPLIQNEFDSDDTKFSNTGDSNLGGQHLLVQPADFHDNLNFQHDSAEQFCKTDVHSKMAGIEQDCDVFQQEYQGQDQLFDSWNESHGNIPAEEDFFPQPIDESRNYKFFEINYYSAYN